MFLYLFYRPLAATVSVLGSRLVELPTHGMSIAVRTSLAVDLAGLPEEGKEEASADLL